MVRMEYSRWHIVLITKEHGNLMLTQCGKNSAAHRKAIPLEDNTVGIGRRKGDAQFIVFDDEIAVVYADVGRLSDPYRLPRCHNQTL